MTLQSEIWSAERHPSLSSYLSPRSLDLFHVTVTSHQDPRHVIR